jgi:hypothetical protein
MLCCAGITMLSKIMSTGLFDVDLRRIPGLLHPIKPGASIAQHHTMYEPSLGAVGFAGQSSPGHAGDNLTL